MPDLYQLDDGRFWDIDAACFVESAPSGAEIVPLYADGKPAGEEYLLRTLKFYGHPLGELEPLDDLLTAKLNEIAAGYDAALTATLTMPAVSPGGAEIALAALDFREDDAEGLDCVREILAARRDELELAARAAQTREELEAVRVEYPV